MEIISYSTLNIIRYNHKELNGKYATNTFQKPLIAVQFTRLFDISFAKYLDVEIKYRYVILLLSNFQNFYNVL